MNLDALWERIFSEDTAQVRRAWEALPHEDRRGMRAFLRRARADVERVDAQRAAAQFALGVIDELPQGALAFARDLARETGARLKAARSGYAVATKPDGTLVTEIDVETDRALGQAVRARYPGHGVLSEEQDKVFGDHEWCWVIDPIDGTTNFAAGFPVWGVLIALLHYGDTVMGVSEFPPLGMQYYAERGRGAWLNDAPIQASAATRLQPNQLFTACSRTTKRGILRIPGKLRSPGSTGFDLCAVASGACVGSVNLTVHVWDIAAAEVIVTEAGGIMEICDGNGYTAPLFPLQPGTDYASVVFTVLAACTPDLFRDAQERLGSTVM